ncbi:hypothetical protein [Desulfuribacillus alkaliarsenatis]|uniref:Uncharacterized protein n=1 Tax=Desulfuribacillus alkaliarsenatis TaxID=766136 RepID=A0A1E5G4L6_9FIRM|nr:hypothetical protein [Desulfuribacillus alkaliarsenatis]OEF98117.1 hypothetical protein BHF68_00030 [Desulfuribacillus alkaliarsenatis]
MKETVSRFYNLFISKKFWFIFIFITIVSPSFDLIILPILFGNSSLYIYIIDWITIKEQLPYYLLYIYLYLPWYIIVSYIFGMALWQIRENYNNVNKNENVRIPLLPAYFYLRWGKFRNVGKDNFLKKASYAGFFLSILVSSIIAIYFLLVNANKDTSVFLMFILTIGMIGTVIASKLLAILFWNIVEDMWKESEAKMCK